jgi:hypothetical protein
LSARKAKKTPPKNVIFGSPRGAEFHREDPSTSMTPICVREAKKMFPLDKPEEIAAYMDEDEETSTNSSILEEADNFMALYMPSPKSKRQSSQEHSSIKKVKSFSPFDLDSARRYDKIHHK